MHELTPIDYKPRKDLSKIDNITKIIGTGIDNIKIIENFLTQKDIDESFYFLNKYEIKHDATHSYQITSLPEYRFERRYEKFASRLGTKMQKVGEILYDQELIRDQGFQLIVHPTGTYIGPHTDILDIDNPDYENDTYESQIERFPYLWSGHLSILAYLNDDYEGGELYFPELDYGIKPKRGMLILFPGSLHYVHGVATITNGIRYTISQWCKFKNFKQTEL